LRRIFPVFPPPPRQPFALLDRLKDITPGERRGAMKFFDPRTYKELYETFPITLFALAVIAAAMVAVFFITGGGPGF
jgi:hypothetical protein